LFYNASDESNWRKTGGGMADRLITETEQHVQALMSGETTGHDWFHVQRVLNNARHIASKEKGADLQIVELAALLHDIADWKFTGGDLLAGPKAVREWLESQGAPEETIKQVAYIVEHISFRGGTNKHVMSTIEGKIVQDADRLDAIGAIGIARVMAFGGAHQRPMHDPTIAPLQNVSFKEYQKTLGSGTSINHFYEKLLLIKDRMNTQAGKDMADARHKFMTEYLEEFLAEWDGKK
jgi:uncharacterized protein